MPLLLPTLGLYLLAAFAEIGGCFAVWAWLRLGKSPLWLVAGALCLALFAYLLTRSQAEFAGRAYAAYGGIYIGASILWLWLIERQIPTRWDLIGGTLCVIGMAVILLGPALQK
ncbi:YnfA family protein [Thioclava sp. GXIMD2076]|uniref:YnfA family protein n=1 Tax=Thioclava kandeliae TaxID=3070818 RepID=A0ABV1SGL2_9RHOB